MNTEELNELASRIIGAAIEVHRILGPGLLEHIYRSALAHELRLRGMTVREESNLPVVYKGVELGFNYRRDLVVEDEIIVELKATFEQHPIHKAQLLTYLRLTGKRIGLLINFHQLTLVDGLHRVVNNL